MCRRHRTSELRLFFETEIFNQDFKSRAFGTVSNDFEPKFVTFGGKLVRASQQIGNTFFFDQPAYEGKANRASSRFRSTTRGKDPREQPHGKSLAFGEAPRALSRDRWGPHSPLRLWLTNAGETLEAI